MADDRLDAFSDRLFAPLGRFIVDFEAVCEAMQNGCVGAFQKAGLRNTALAEIAVAGLSAAPLLDVYLSTISEAFTLTESQAKQLDEIKKRVQSLITNRNRTMHSAWTLIDFADLEHGAPDAILTASRRRSHGLERQTNVQSRDDLQELSVEARNIMRAVRLFSSSLGEAA